MSQDSHGNYNQLQYDDPDSLLLKYVAATNLGLRGVGFWHIDSLDYSDTETGRFIRYSMFEVLPYYKNM